MKAFVVCWHPEPRSFNHAMFVAARRALERSGWQVTASDLHAMAFDPVSSRANFRSVKDPEYLKPQVEEQHATAVDGFAADIEAELRKLEACDLMVWQFPLWWFGLPAVLKGWVDRVFVMGRVYGGGRVYERGVFAGKRAMLSLTTGGPADAFRRDGFNGDIDGILRPIHRGMLEFVGFDVMAPHVVYGPARMNDAQRRAELERFERRLSTLGDETPIDVGAY
jgi:NAD(P)H dehydrogenase (quinone)